MLRVISAIFTLLCVFSCTKSQPKAQDLQANPAETALAKDQALITKGKTIFQTNCTVCHNMDPSKDGSVGPAVSGSSQELIEARMTSGTYPPGYKAKRDTHVMPKFPQFAADSAALAAYLASTSAK